MGARLGLGATLGKLALQRTQGLCANRRRQTRMTGLGATPKSRRSSPRQSDAVLIAKAQLGGVCTTNSNADSLNGRGFTDSANLESTAFLVLFARTAGAGLVATDLAC